MVGYRGGIFWGTKCFLLITGHKPEMATLLWPPTVKRQSSQLVHRPLILTAYTQKWPPTRTLKAEAMYCWPSCLQLQVLCLVHPNDKCSCGVQNPNCVSWPKFLEKPIFLPSLSSKRVPNKCLYVPQMNLGYFVHQLSSKSLLPPNATSPSYIMIYFSRLLAPPLLRMTVSPPLGLQKHS